MINDTVNITSSPTLTPIKPVFGASFANVDKIVQVEKNSKVAGYIADLKLNYLAGWNGTIGNYFQLRDEHGGFGRGNNCPLITTVDECQISAIWSTELDYYFTAMLNNSKLYVTLNCLTPLKNIDLLRTQLNTFKSDVAAHGLEIAQFQVGAEMHTVTDITTFKNFCAQAIPVIRSIFPTALLIADTFGDVRWDSELFKLPFDGFRMYYCVAANECLIYSDFKKYCNDVPKFVDDTFNQTDRNGKKIVPANWKLSISQTEMVNNHPLFGTQDAAMGFLQMYGNFAKKNILTDNLCYIGQFNLKELFDGKTLEPLPTYDAVKAISQVFGQGYKTSSSQGGFWSLACGDTQKTKLIYLNDKGDDVSLKANINGAPKSFTDITIYGDDSPRAASNIVPSNSFAVINL